MKETARSNISNTRKRTLVSAALWRQFLPQQDISDPSQRGSVPEFVNYKAFAIPGLAQTELKPDLRGRLGEALTGIALSTQWWQDDSGLRYSLLKCELHLGRYVVGVFTQQHNLKRHLYDDKKRETEDHTDSYEDRFFVLDLETGLIYVEWRRFIAKPPLTLTLAIRRLGEVLSEVFSTILGAPVVQLEPIRAETSREQFIELFYEFKVRAVEIRNFGSHNVPPEVQLVNPNPHLDDAMRDIVVHDAERPSIEMMTISAGDNAENDLRRAAIVRAAVHSSDPEWLRYERASGEVRVRRKTENGVFSVSIPTLATDTPEDRLFIAAHVIRDVSEVDMGIPLVPPSSSLPPTQRHSPNLDLFADMDLVDE